MRRVSRKFVPIDGEALLLELQNKSVADNEPAPVEEPKPEPVNPKADELSRRQSIKDNPRNLFILDARNGTVHDKDCPLVMKIPLSCFWGRSKLPGTKEEICPECFARAMVRAVAGGDNKHIDAYCGFFRRIGFGKGILYRLCAQNQTRLLGIDRDSVRLKVNDDKWILVKTENRAELWHNDYFVCEDYSRIFYDTYHRQARIRLGGSQGARVLADIIFAYSWEEHILRLKEKEALRRLHEELQAKWKNKVNYRVEKRGLFRTKVSYIDIGTSSFELLGEEGVKARFIHRRRCRPDESFPRRDCRIKHRDFEAFRKVMLKLRQMSFCEEHKRFVDCCFEKTERLTETDIQRKEKHE